VEYEDCSDVTLGSLVGIAFRLKDPAAFIYDTGGCLHQLTPATQVDTYKQWRR
jgi:hypothetical protein